MSVDLLRTLLTEEFPDASHVDVVDRTGGGDHFHVVVVSPTFNGLKLIQQHSLINKALAGPLADGTIHELRITTKGTAS